MFQRNVILGSLLLLAGCPSTPTPTTPATTEGAGAKVEAVPTNPCPADAAWITSPSMPTDVPADPSNCDFHQFAWQSFLYLVNPATPPALTFETFMSDAGIFVGSGQTPTPYGQPAPQGGSCPTGAKLQLRQADRMSGPASAATAGDLNEILQAGSAEPLVDQANRFVHYGVSYNQTQYDYLTTCDLYRDDCFDNTMSPDGQTSSVDFPAGSTELKAAWHVVETCNLPDSPKPCTPEDVSDFYTTTAVVQPYSASDPSCVAVTVALVGMHVVTKTPLHPEWIWASFEHVDNAPDCANTSEKPPEGDGWTFFDPACTGNNCTPNTYVDGCGNTKYTPSCQTQVPIQVCREAPIGAGTTGNVENVTAINASVSSLLPKGSVWNNYTLVGTLWLDQSQQPTPPERGSTFLANTTAETYVQSKVTDTSPTNCFSCHTPGPAASPTTASFGASADGSHAFAVIDNADACPTDLPSTCPTAPPATAAVVPASAPTGAGTPAVPAAPAK